MNSNLALLLIPIAYLIGSISFAVVVSKCMRLPDPHSYGSGNPGATNVLRTGNKLAAVLTLLGDASVGGANDRLTARFELAPGAKKTIRFLLTWRFPNMQNLPGVGKQVPHHATRFPDAAAVARHVADRFDTLRDATMKWVSTWNDSTLPQWLLDRSILTTNTLQTSNCHVFANRRFWAWLGNREHHRRTPRG